MTKKADSKTILAATAVMLAATCASAADGGLPHIDLDARCRLSAKSTQEVMGDASVKPNAFASCKRAEGEARDALAAAWKDIPPRLKTMCIRPKDYAPSYVEWIACLELQIDLKRLRARQ